jgi:hypothetical protein
MDGGGGSVSLVERRVLETPNAVLIWGDGLGFEAVVGYGGFHQLVDGQLGSQFHQLMRHDSR